MHGATPPSLARIQRRPAAREGLIALWLYIADDSDEAADAVLDRIEAALSMLAERPLAGRPRLELAVDLRSFPVGRHILFYRPMRGGIDLVRVLSSDRDLDPGDVAE